MTLSLNIDLERDLPKGVVERIHRVAKEEGRSEEEVLAEAVEIGLRKMESATKGISQP